MKHYGDITKINGANVPLVDIICGGSPCQDLSVAGKRAGLAGERSGLFMEQIRIIKEMRCKSVNELRMFGAAIDRRRIRPRFMVWENVVGALSSNNGEDFRAVIEETAKIADENAAIPGLAKGEKWRNAGLILGDGYSIAWRVHDAQYHGVPQRRRRICLLADFNGDEAGRLLFELRRKAVNSEADEAITNFGNGDGSKIQLEREGLSRNTKQIGTPRKESSATTEGSANSPGGGMIVLEGNGSRESHNGDGYRESDTMYTLNTIERHAVLSGGGGITITASKASHFTNANSDGTANTLVATDYKDPQIVCYGIGGGGSESPVIQSGRYVQEITRG
jgi:DNA (cytosine-5)-methyltransferase 1